MISAYITALILVMPVLLVQEKMNSTKQGEKNNGYNNKIIWYIILIFVLIVGFRDTATIAIRSFGENDEVRYRYYFNLFINTPFSLSNIDSYEWGRYFLDWTLANIFKNFQAWVFTYAIITNILFVKAINKYVKPFWFGIYLYIIG